MSNASLWENVASLPRPPNKYGLLLTCVLRGLCLWVPGDPVILTEGVVLGAAFFRFLGAASFMEKCEKARVVNAFPKKQPKKTKLQALWLGSPSLGT